MKYVAKSAAESISGGSCVTVTISLALLVDDDDDDVVSIFTGFVMLSSSSSGGGVVVVDVVWAYARSIAVVAAALVKAYACSKKEQCCQENEIQIHFVILSSSICACHSKASAKHFSQCIRIQL